jgi:hypothetical protein
MNEKTEIPLVNPRGNWYRLIEMPQLYGGNPHLTISRYYLVDAVEGSNFWIRCDRDHEVSFGSSRFDLEHPVVLPTAEVVRASQDEWRAWHSQMTITHKWSIWEGGSLEVSTNYRLLSDGLGWYVVLDARSPIGLVPDATSYWLIRVPILGIEKPDPAGMWPMGVSILRLLMGSCASYFPRNRGNGLEPAVP